MVITALCEFDHQNIPRTPPITVEYEQRVVQLMDILEIPTALKPQIDDYMENRRRWWEVLDIDTILDDTRQTDPIIGLVQSPTNDHGLIAEKNV